jgi:Flp pilus assembly pilin Flp
MLALFKCFLKEEDGLGTVEIVVIIAVLVGLALIFRRAIFSFVNQILDKIFNSTGEVVGAPSSADVHNRTVN